MSKEARGTVDLIYPQIVLPVDYRSKSVWLLRALSFDENRKALSGLVYEDDISVQYGYTSFVPNSSKIKPGDLVLLRDNKMLLGSAVIRQIEKEEKLIKRLRCPICNRASMIYRKTTDDWRCDGTCQKQGVDPDARSTKHPVESWEPGIEYVADYSGTWSDLPRKMKVEDFQKLSDPDSWNKQNSIVALDLSKVSLFLSELRISAREIIGEDYEELITAGGFDNQISKRRLGQTQFRGHLFAEFGSNCAFTGPCYFGALDAAHLYSYTQVGEHRKGGGLLMRRDLHTLFDRGLVGVNKKQQVALHQDLLDTQYGYLLGENLKVQTGRKERMYLAEHYETHSPKLVTP